MAAADEGAVVAEDSSPLKEEEEENVKEEVVEEASSDKTSSGEDSLVVEEEAFGIDVGAEDAVCPMRGKKKEKKKVRKKPNGNAISMFGFNANKEATRTKQRLRHTANSYDSFLPVSGEKSCEE